MRLIELAAPMYAGHSAPTTIDGLKAMSNQVDHGMVAEDIDLVRRIAVG